MNPRRIQSSLPHQHRRDPIDEWAPATSVVTRSYVEVTDDRVGDSLAAEIANQPLLMASSAAIRMPSLSSPETLATAALVRAQARQSTVRHTLMTITRPI